MEEGDGAKMKKQGRKDKVLGGGALLGQLGKRPFGEEMSRDLNEVRK